MKIQINTGKNIGGREEMIRKTEALIENTLGHLTEDITRLKVHLSDENSKKNGGNDKRCLIESRIRGHQPIAVSCEADTIFQAINGAVDKLKKSLVHTLGRLSAHEARKHVKSHTFDPLAEGKGKESNTAKAP